MTSKEIMSRRITYQMRRILLKDIQRFLKAANNGSYFEYSWETIPCKFIHVNPHAIKWI